MSQIDDAPLHALWTKAAGHPGYDKAEWKQLEAKLHSALAALHEIGGLTRWVGHAAHDQSLADADMRAIKEKVESVLGVSFPEYT